MSIAIEAMKAGAAVMDLGALLSVKPHSQDPELADRYFEWVQGVERAHAKIRDEIERLQALSQIVPAQGDEVARLRKALEPFAKEAAAWPDHVWGLYKIGNCQTVEIRVDDLRRARAALAIPTTEEH